MALHLNLRCSVKGPRFWQSPQTDYPTYSPSLIGKMYTTKGLHVYSMAYVPILDIFYRYHRFIMSLFTIVCPVSKEDQGVVFPGVPLFRSILFLEEISPTAKGLNIYQTVNQHNRNFHILSYRLNAFSILFKQDNEIHRIRTTCRHCGVRSQLNNYLIYSLCVVNYRAVCVIRRNFIHTSHNTPVNGPALDGIVPRRRRHEP